MRLAKCGKEWKTVKPTHKKIYIKMKTKNYNN